jgi:hypothetical protein
MIQREISRVLVLNISGEENGAQNTDRRSLSSTTPSLLSRASLPAAFDFDVARVGRTLLSDAFDFAFDFDREGDGFSRAAKLPIKFNPAFSR